MQLPVDPRGAALEAMRSAYRTVMRFPGAPQELVEVRWYETDRPFLKVSTVYNSLNWCEPRDAKTFPAGELDGNARPWVNGAAPGSIGPGPPLGSPDAWLGETDGNSTLYLVGEACWFDVSATLAVEASGIVAEGIAVAGVEDLGVDLLATVGEGIAVSGVEDLGVETEAEIADTIGGVEDLAVESDASISETIGGVEDLAVELEGVVEPNVDGSIDLVVEMDETPALLPTMDLAVELEATVS